MNEQVRQDLLDGKVTKEDLILSNTDRLCTLLDDLSNRLYKIIYAILGLLGASIGLKFIGTPWYVDLLVFLSITASIFVGAYTLMNWSLMTKLQRAHRLTYFSIPAALAGLNIFLYRPSVIEPHIWFIPGIDIFLSIIVTSFIIMTWKAKHLHTIEGSCEVNFTETGKS